MASEKNIRTISNTIGEVMKIILLSDGAFLGDHDFNITVSDSYYPEAKIEFGLSCLGWKTLEPLANYFIKENINWSVKYGEKEGQSLCIVFDHENK